MISQRISNYQIVAKLGAGGMGDVYLATDLVLGRKAAIKLLRPNLLEDQSSKARFLREARAIAALSHPGIAVIFEAGEFGDRPYLAMEYVEGKTLSVLIAAGPVSGALLLDYAIQMASALNHAHSRGIIHRDIKPSNAVVTPEGAVKLLDFGLARILQAGDETRSDAGSLTSPGTFLGTIEYAAPELFSGGEASVRSDIYSLGVMLYEMACGWNPFAGLSGLSLIGAILRADAPPVRQRDPQVSSALARVIESSMALRPEDRCATAADLVKALQAAATGAVPASSSFPEPPVQIVAVLEFQNISNDSAIDWLGTGLAETLVSDLRKLEGIRLISRERVQESMRRRGPNLSPAELGGELNARWVVSGSYQRAGNRLRITPRLVDVSTGDTVATAKVDGNWEEVFELQDRVVAGLAEALQVKARPRAGPAAPAEAVRLEAYEQYALGRKRLLELGKSALEEVRQRFERAIALDPGYAAAYSALGWTHALRFIARTNPEDLARAQQYLERALTLDPEMGEPYPFLCYIYMRQNKVREAIEAGKQAVARQPDLHFSHYFLGVTYLVNAEFDPDYHQRAILHLLDAAEVGPRYEPIWFVLCVAALTVGNYERAEHFASNIMELRSSGKTLGGWVGTELLQGNLRLRRGDWDGAIQEYTRGLESLVESDHVYREPIMTLCACGQGDARLRQGDAVRALADFRSAWRMIAEYPRMLGHERVLTRAMAGLAAAYAAQGDRARAEQLLGEAASHLDAVAKQPGSYIFNASTPELCYSLAAAHLRCENSERALELLERAAQAGWRDPNWLAADPELDRLRGNPRLLLLLQQLRQAAPLRWQQRQR